MRGDRSRVDHERLPVEQVGELEQRRAPHAHARFASCTGSDHLERAVFETPEGELDLALSAVFVFIGQQPRTAWLEGVAACDERGFVLTGSDVADGHGWNLDREPGLLESSLPGVFAAGDVRHRSIKRIASAVGEGAMAVQLVHEYMAEL